MGRVSIFTGAVLVNDSTNAIDVGSSFVIHALTIGDGVSLTTSTFQDFVTSIRSYAPTTIGNSNIPHNNDINISSVEVNVTSTAPYLNV